MANFLPVKRYQALLIEKCLNNYPDICSPFLEVGCGTGFFLQLLETKGFYGKGIDISKQPIRQAQALGLAKVQVKQADVFTEDGRYNLVLLIDVLEHIKDDAKCLERVSELLNNHGYLILQVPSHRWKYSWIDARYGHYRRYNRGDVIALLKNTSLRILKLYCVGFPFFSLTETFFGFAGKYFVNQKKGKEAQRKAMAQCTSKSGIISPVAEALPATKRLFDRTLNVAPVWRALYHILDLFLDTNLGSTYFVLCKKEISALGEK